MDDGSIPVKVVDIKEALPNREGEQEGAHRDHLHKPLGQVTSEHTKYILQLTRRLGRELLTPEVVLQQSIKSIETTHSPGPVK